MKVAVIGCGAMGAATGWRLQKRGAEVVCFDRFSPPHDLGSTHGESRATRTAYIEGAWYVPLLQETFPMWRELEAESRQQLLTLNGLLMLGTAKSESVIASQAAAREHGLEIRLLDATELRRRYPGHIVADNEVAVFDPQAGFLRLEATMSAMIQGLEVRRNTRVTRVTPKATGVEVETASGAETFDAAVVATGSWMHELAPFLPLKVERQVLVWLAIQSGADWFGPERFPVWLREGSPQGDVYGLPSLDGQSIKIARHHGGEPADPDSVRRAATDADLDPLRLFVTKYLHGVTRHVTRSAVCLYTNTPDQNFAIGPHPESSRVVILSACSGHGFKFAPIVGDIAADLVLDGGTRRDISHFALQRFT
ncbi:MAG TPA: N-methyl-L-tryptophan oxidase [Candidatus Dormibacteraeota bacterium]|nr:N-methyl-L-tryptophan oxidase [Candidatus Dormibacteraeota bacterium]